jgi:hypothetical protein
MTHDPEPLPTIERTAPGAADPDAVPALARDLDRLVAVQSPALAPLLRWSASPDGVVLVHRVPDAAAPLDAVRRTGPLRAGHVLAVALATAAALEAMHDAGLAHGGVDLGQVLVAPDGSVVLAGAGLAWRAAPGRLDGPTAEGDVAALGELVRLLLGQGAAPGPLVVAALRASDPDPSMRPTAAALRDLLRSCGRPESLLDALWQQPVVPRPTGAAPRPGAQQRPAPDEPEPRPRRRTPAPAPRRVPFRTVAVVALLLVVGAGAVRAVGAVGAVASEPAASPTAGEPAAGPPPVPVEETPSADWATVLAALDSGRRQALESGGRDALARWVDPAGPAWDRDSALLDRFARAQARIVGGELVLEQVQVERTEAGRVLLAVRDRRAAYDVTEAGTTTHVPERAGQWWTVTLTPMPALDGDGWRIAEVRGREDRAG